LKDFADIKDFDPVFVFWTGVLKPYVGSILAIFVYAFLRSEFSPIKDVGPNLDQPQYAWWTIGFLSGFSERFTWDIISRSEGVLNKADGSDRK
jgi:hypothetical protein